MGTVTFQNTDAMIKMSSMNPVGTIAYVIDEEALLVRVNKGWQYIAVSLCLLKLSTHLLFSIKVGNATSINDSTAHNNVNVSIIRTGFASIKLD